MGLFAIALRDRARRLPQTHLTGLLASPAATTGPAFRARIDATSPSGGPSSPSGGGNEDAPRAQQHDDIYFEAAALDGTTVELVAGDRITVAVAGQGTDSWELTRAPTPHRLFAGPIIYTGEALRVSRLYPLSGTLRELGGAAVPGGGPVPLGLWRTAQSAAEAGEQYVYEAEAPYEWLDKLDPGAHPNRELVIAGAAHRIAAAVPNQSAPRIVLTLRRVRPGG